MVEWSSLLGLRTVPVIYSGLWDEKLVKNMRIENYNGDPCEGYVVRLSASFDYYHFRQSVAKCVYSNFNNDTKDRHNWMHKQVIPNTLKG